ncbi:MAG: hypothetical protein ABF274_06205 [Nonlabens sp.]|uniref:hypothetical protein n=1 Tax=Nonlabens sp. TaxID=1888209 RepID=UPI00321A1E74
MNKIIKFLYRKGFLKIIPEVIEKASKSADLDLLLLGLDDKNFNIRIKAVVALSKYAKQNDEVYEAICKTIHNNITIVSLNAMNSLILQNHNEYEKWQKTFKTKKKELIDSNKIGIEISTYGYTDFSNLKINQKIRMAESYKRNQMLLLLVLLHLCLD